MSVSIKDSRCGEIYVSNKADKWTFFCSYCQKGTSDIGVFICHIRLDHLNGMLDCQSQNENRLTPQAERSIPITSELQSTPTLPLGVFFQTNEEQEAENNLIKEETLSQNSFNSEATPTRISEIEDNSTLNNSNETENVPSAQKSSATDNPTIEINEEYFTITSKDPNIKQEDTYSGQENHEIIRVLYSKNEKNINKTNDETIYIDDVEDVCNIDTSSIYSINDDDENDNDVIIEDDLDFENIDDNRASSSKRSKELRYIVPHICTFCNINFKLRNDLDYHLKNVHNQKLREMPLKCKECKKGFRSIAGLRNHLKSHDERNQVECPICRAKHNLSYFITHVMGHESDTCFPCQVCGKIFLNNVERMQHWKSHAKDKPFPCDLCYRRFRRKHFLIHHLKRHGQYKCYFCPEKFVTNQTPRPPYICPNCEQLPDIWSKIEHQKLFANKNHIHESDEE